MLLRIVIASPSDVHQEREAADRVIRDIARQEASVDRFETFLWESKVGPGFSRNLQIGLIDPEARIRDSDIVVVIFSARLGTPIAPGKPTGTQHEFEIALESWRLTGRPQVMVYFNAAPPNPTTNNEIDQYTALMRFKLSLPADGLYGSYSGPAEFERLFGEHLPLALKRVRGKVKAPFVEETYKTFVRTIKSEEHDILCVCQNPRLDSSFPLKGDDKPFVQMEISTTQGYVPNRKYKKGSNQSRWKPLRQEIFLVRDPVRPFEIQIGKYRAERHGRNPREVPFEGVPGYSELQTLYPLMLDDGHRWLRVVFAELLSDPTALEYMYEKEPDPAVKAVIARNPSAPDEVRATDCPFCDPKFCDERKLGSFESKAMIMANDFPFGPYFHYIVFPADGVHAWDRVEIEHLYEMNWLAHRFLTAQKEKGTLGAKGLRIGFNSSIRHLVMGRRTRSSAGASIAHVHKQIWGMAPHSVNLADHLRAICLAHEQREKHRDYLESYYLALLDAGLVIWEDPYVALFVPFGQSAVHELQIMVKRPGTRTFLDLDHDEIQSLSLAEYIVTRLYGRMDINSFNEILLSLPFEDKESTTFRLIFTFITREVDLAISELSLLYVVDQHPSHTVMEINRVWPTRNPSDLHSKTAPPPAAKD